MTPLTYSTVCPYLMVDSIENQMEFLQTVFGADFPSQPSMNYVYVNDVNRTYSMALALGSTSVFEPADRFYGVREAGFKDLHNNTWFVAQHLKDVSMEDMEKGFADKKG